MSILIAPEDNERFARLQSYEQSSARASNTDYGLFRGMATSASEGFQNNVTMTLAKWVTKNALDDKEDPRVAEDEFNTSYAPILGLEYDPTESRASLDYRIHLAAKQRKANEVISGKKRSVANFSAAMVGGMATDPLGWLPLALPSKALQLGKLHALAGNRAAAAYHTGKGTFTNVLAVNAAYEVPYAYMMNDIGVNKYTLESLAYSVAGNLGFSALLGTGAGYFANRQANKANHYARQDAELGKMFREDNLQAALNLASEGDFFVVRDMFDKHPHLREWATGDRPLALSEQDHAIAQEILEMQELHLAVKAATRLSARSKIRRSGLGRTVNKTSVRRRMAEHKEQANRLSTYLLYSSDAQKLTDADVQILKDLGYEFNTVPQVTKSKQVVEGYGVLTQAAQVYGGQLFKIISDTEQKRRREFQIEDFDLKEVARKLKELREDPSITPRKRDALEKSLKADAQKLLDEQRELRAKIQNGYRQVRNLTPNFESTVRQAQDLVDFIFFGGAAKTEVQVLTPQQSRRFGDDTLGFTLTDIDNFTTYLSEPYFFFEDGAINAESAYQAALRSGESSGKIAKIREQALGDEASPAPNPKLLMRSGTLLRDRAFKAYNETTGRNFLDNAAYLSVFRTLMHESMHHLKKIDPEAHAMILTAIDDAEMKVLFEHAVGKGYSADKAFADETGSLLIEFAITRPEFWKALVEKDPALAGKTTKFIEELAADLYATLGMYDSPTWMKEFQNVGNNPDKIARTVSETLTTIRNDTTFRHRLAKYSEQAEQVRESTLDPTSDPFLDVDDFDMAKVNLDEIKSRAKGQQKAQTDLNASNEQRIAELFGGDEAVYAGIQKLSLLPLAKQREQLPKFVELLERRGFGFITAEDVSSMLQTLGATKKRQKEIAKALAKYSGDMDGLREYLRKNQLKLPLEAASRIGYIIMDKTLSRTDKMRQVLDYLTTEESASILRILHDRVNEKNIRALIDDSRTPQMRVNQLKTFMDGSRRKGVKLGQSVQTLVRGQILKDQTPLLDFLVEKDLLELFLGEDPSSYMSSYVKNTVGNKDLSRLFGSDLAKASNLLHKQIMEALTNGELPKQWKGVEVLEELVDVIRSTNLAQLFDMNSLGIMVRDRKGFLGYSMTYDRSYIQSLGYDAFEAKMLKMIDMKATERAHGGFMAERPDSTTAKLKDAGAFVKFNKETFLRGLYEEIVEGSFVNDPNDPSSSVLGSQRKAAKIIFKPEYRIEALIEFSNRKNLGRFMLEQIRNRSEKIALVKHVGHDANRILTNLIDSRATKGSRLTAKATIDQITGVLDTPVDANLNSTFKAVRQVQNIAMLGTAGFSTISDIPLVWNTLQFLGVAPEGLGVYFSRYADAVAAQFGGDKTQMSNWFRAQGASFDLLTRSMAQRVITDDSNTFGRIGLANDFVFELNGLNRLTAAHQQLFVDMLTSGLAKELRSNEINPLTLQRLTEYGFTEKDINNLRKAVEKTPDGVYRIGPSNIADVKLREKLSSFFTQYMREGVIEPDAGAQAMSRLGLQAGTMGGETARLALQYSSFMLAMGRVVYRRFLNGYGDEGKVQAFRNAHMYTYLAMALAAAYMSTVLKDLSRFKEPMNPLDMSEQDWMRIIRQSGLLSYFEPAFNAAQFGPSAAFGPAVGTAEDIASLDIGDAVGPYLGENLPIAGPVIKQISHTASEIITNFVGEETEKADKAARQSLDNK